MKTMTMRAAPAFLLVAVSGPAAAAGFQLWEQNASGIATAFAGSAAVADNASTIFFNPAGMTQLSGIQLSVGVAGVKPSFEFSDEASSGTGALAGLSGGNGGDAGRTRAVPNAYFSAQVAPDWFVGLGISSPFGLSTEYDDNWIGRYQAIKSEITTVNYNPSLAYKINDKVSLGVGLSYQTIDAEMTNATPLGRYQFKGDDTAWGWNAGALFTLSPAMRVGVSYRSAVDYKLEGNRTLGAASSSATADIKLPDVVILSVWQQVSDRWEAIGDLSYTNWSTLGALSVQHAGGTDGERITYQDSWRIAWGAAYKASDAWKIKFGIAYDQTTASGSDRSARLPDNDRLWFSFGGQWNGGPYGRIDAGYAYLFVKDANITQSKDFGPAGSATLRGRYGENAQLLGAQYSVGF